MYAQQRKLQHRKSKRRGREGGREWAAERTKGQLRVATKVVLHIIVLVFVLAKSPQSSCCQLCVFVCLRLDVSRLDDACYRCEPSVHSAQLSVGFSVSFGIRLSFQLCLYSNLLVYLALVLATFAAVPVAAAASTAAAAVNWPMAFCLQNISETLPRLFPFGIFISVVLCALELWAPVYYCGPIMIICLSSVPVH